MDHSYPPNVMNNYHNQRPAPTKKELLSSAKVVVGAAKATASHEKEKVDKGKVAGAAANLIAGASHYGKLEDKKLGKYVQKAENYLQKYNSPHPTNNSIPNNHSHGNSHSGGKYGDYLKIAEGFLKKH